MLDSSVFIVHVLTSNTGVLTSCRLSAGAFMVGARAVLVSAWLLEPILSANRMADFFSFRFTVGCEVHMVCNKHDRFQLPNVTCIYLESHLDYSVKTQLADDTYTIVTKIFEAIENTTKTALKIPTFTDFINQTKKFDMIIVDYVLLSMVYPFLHGRTYGIISTTTLEPAQSAVFGNVQSPAHFNCGTVEFPKPYSLLDRLKNLGNTFMYFAFKCYANSIAIRLISKQFPDAPSYFEVERNASLHLLTTSSALDGPVGLYPTQVPVPGLIFRPRQPLAKDLADFIEGDVPVIYTGFGVTTINLGYIAKDVMDAMISVFRRLPYKVILKVNGLQTHIDGNVFFRADVPQQDILAHPNVKLFIGHGGVAGAQEAVYNSVPGIFIPYTHDQVKMAHTLVNAGVAIQLSWRDFHEQEFEDAIKELMTNHKYREKMASLSRVYRDDQEHSLDRAVYWTEYVARTKGAPHLQPPGKQLSWIQIFCLDLLAIILSICSILFFVSRWAIRYLFRSFFMKKKKKRH
ncbi:UDP-glucuronosyl/UDP-glucosyltransferase [Trinorchestia longiramus]|nr:UDP-glucuronosyl/UDP-glucosyltransferase [Trinorchestia longiramus]